MRLTTNPTRPVFMDLETQSGCDLRQYGGRHYAAHESTRVLTAVFLIDGTYHVWIPVYRDCPTGFTVRWPVGLGEPQPVETWFGGGVPRPVLWAMDRTWVAHNAAGFDAHVWEALYPQYTPANWYDTTHSARAAGLPGSLDELGKRFFGRGKDKGAEILKRLYTLERVGNEWVNKNTAKPGYISSVATYNIADVVILEKVYQETRDYGEADVIQSHHAVNSRGVAFDSELAGVLGRLSDKCTAAAAEEVSRITGGVLHADNIRSVPQVKRWLASRGVPLKSLDKRVVDRMLTNPDGLIADLLEGEDAAGDPARRAASAAIAADGNADHGGQA